MRLTCQCFWKTSRESSWYLQDHCVVSFSLISHLINYCLSYEGTKYVDEECWPVSVVQDSEKKEGEPSNTFVIHGISQTVVYSCRSYGHYLTAGALGCA